VQQRALAGERYRGVWETLYRLVRGNHNFSMTAMPLPRLPGPDPANPKPLLAGLSRIYQGLGVSALRSITTHGLLWTFFDTAANYIDSLPNPSEN